MTEEHTELNVAAIMRNSESQILAYKSDGRWINPFSKKLLYTIPGTEVKPEEFFEDAVKRLVEEYGLTLINQKRLPEILQANDPYELYPFVKQRHIVYLEFIVNVEGISNRENIEWINPHKFYIEHYADIESFTRSVLQHHIGEINPLQKETEKEKKYYSRNNQPK